VTGLSNFNFELQGKRLELFREAVPGARRVALLHNPDNPVLHARFIREFETATRALSMDSMILAARNPTEIDAALSKARSSAIEVLIVADDGAFFGLRQHIADRGAHERLPLICGFAAMARAGCLFSYGNDLLNDLERAASYVDKILKGAQPAELPIEQPTKLELVVNLKTATALGLTMPPKLLARADEVIE
jgi:putative ABC transport system substrate-binding protein